MAQKGTLGAAMRPFDLCAVLIVLAAVLSYLNVRWLKLPSTIGLMALALVFALSVVVFGSIFPVVGDEARAIVRQFDLSEALLHGMLGFLLFAGALHVDIGDLASYKWAITLLATLGVLISVVIVAALTWAALGFCGIHLRAIDCLLFGSLISPTDPISVLALLKKIGAPKALEIQIAGESLFNDGVGVAVFTGLLEIATGEFDLDGRHLAVLFAQEAVGGIVFGLLIGLLVYRLLKTVDDYQVEILLSLALVAGGYALADTLHLSGPIAMVVAGLLIGNHGRSFAMSPTTIDHLDLFWSLVDEILNAILFVLIGLEVLILTFSRSYLVAGMLAVVIVLTARLVSVGLPVWILRRWEQFEISMVPILTWGGLRGGISVALALSIPDTMPARNAILTITYVVVVFSILVQGLTVGLFTRRWVERTGQAIRTDSESHAGVNAVGDRQ
jgi:CPA1 family monovalent cation:H+ antiporter